MLRWLVFFWVFSLMLVFEVDSRISLSRGLSRMGSNFMKRNRDPSGMLNTAASVSSVYVGSTGMWWRSGIVASINQLEQGKKEEAMETLNIAIATLTVFDTTQATVQPIASELIHQLVKHKGQFPETVKGLTNYNKALTEKTIAGSADDADDIVDSANSLRKRIGNAFDTEVTTFMKNTQGFDDLVKSLNNAKKWAKAVTWLDTFSGPLFDVANVAFCGWQLHNAIKDEDSPPDVKALNIASASLGVASGAVGVVSFVAGALATAGSTLAAFAGPVGALIGCVLGLASIIIDLINSSNPAGTIKEHLETIQALKKGSLQYLENDVNLTQALASKFDRNIGFDSVYQVNQGNLIMALRKDAYKTIQGADNDPNVAFDIKSSPGDEDGYLAIGKNRIFDKSKYANLLWQPEGQVPLGYDFYGKVVKPNGKGVTVFATTAMVAEQFWVRGIKIDTTLENDEAAPDNVIIGDLSGLVVSSSKIEVKTGAGDDLLHVTGVTCNRWTQGGFQARLGSGVNTLSFQGMNPDRRKFAESASDEGRFKIFAGIDFNMHPKELHASLYFKLKDSESSSEVQTFGVGKITDVNVLYGSPFDDKITLYDVTDSIVKSDGGRNDYVLWLSNERDGKDFTHTITDDSDDLGNVYIATKIPDSSPWAFKDVIETDVAYNKETQTLVIFLRDQQKKHKITGRVIFKRTKPGDIGEMRVYVTTVGDQKDRCKQISGLNRRKVICENPKSLNELSREIGSNQGSPIDDRPVPLVPFKYNMDVDLTAQAISGLCGDFVISVNNGQDPQVGQTKEHTLQLPQNSFLVINDNIVDRWTNYDGSTYPALYYKKSEKKLYYEIRSSSSGGFSKGTIKISVPQAKRIVVGTAGSYQLLYDIKHDDRPAVNLASEYEGLKSRPSDEYKFTENFNDDSDTPKQIVLGVPSKTASSTRWKITFGEAKTDAGKKYGSEATGDYAENALIVSDALWEHLSRDDNTMRIKFKPDKKVQNGWRIIVKNNDQTLHRALVTGANTLAYHNKAVRINLHDLFNGQKQAFNLVGVLKEKINAIQSDITSEASICL